MEPRISAIIASYNRLSVLQTCIAALRAQTRPLDDIIVVDGDSTDGTRAWLQTQPDLTPVLIQDLGSAGSMHAGMEWAFHHGSDWIWLFDDDVVAAPTALAELLRAHELRPRIRVLNSLSIGAEDAARPAVGALLWRNNVNEFTYGRFLYSLPEIRAHADEEGFLDSAGGQLYQGTLIQREVVKEVGLPLTALFTRGDEIEYALRVMQSGYHIYSYLPSVVTHPTTRIVFIHAFGRTFPCESMGAKKRYYSIRNSIYIRRMYYQDQPFLLYILRRLAGAFVTEVLIEPNASLAERLKSFAAAVRGARDGLRTVKAFAGAARLTDLPEGNSF